jgi:hypothetical protein
MSTRTSITDLVKTNFVEILEDKNECFGFYDWFCKDSSLKNKAKTLVGRLQTILENNKRFNPDTTYVFFKNNCPGCGGLYDDFRICDIETGKVLYTVTPSDPHEGGEASIWTKENDFKEPLVIGSWADIKLFFATAA